MPSGSLDGPRVREDLVARCPGRRTCRFRGFDCRCRTRVSVLEDLGVLCGRSCRSGMENLSTGGVLGVPDSRRTLASEKKIMSVRSVDLGEVRVPRVRLDNWTPGTVLGELGVSGVRRGSVFRVEGLGVP